MNIETRNEKVDEFLALFGELEQILGISVTYDKCKHEPKCECLEHKHISFNELVSRCKRLREEEKDILYSIGSLRNLYSHKKQEKLRELATPQPIAVEHLERILERLGKGEKVKGRMTQDPIQYLVNDPLIKLINGLVTANDIAIWLAKYLGKGLIDLHKTKVRALLDVEDELPKVRHAFVAQDELLVTAEGRFIENECLEVLLVTKDGKESSDLLGIFTLWNLSSTPTLQKKVKSSSPTISKLRMNTQK
jgi:hypothetical protein